jgi:putative membrane protein
MLRWLIASLHLLGLAVALGAIVARARALRAPAEAARLPAAFAADNLWGISALLLLSTGLWRAFGGLEKGSAYYLGSHTFWGKMLLLALILVLEVWPMVTLIRWRIARGRGAVVDLSAAPMIARVSAVQAVLVVAMIFAATAMARGIGF